MSLWHCLEVELAVVWEVLKVLEVLEMMLN